MKKHLLFPLFILITSILMAQQVHKRDSVTFIFMGDVMGHDPQIEAAYNPITKKYHYDSVFKKIAPVIKNADFAIANLEVTLGGKPYKGYPQFSSPDALAVACKNAGIDVLVTSNNHSCDRKKMGVLRTINVLDSLEIKHTGTFRNLVDRTQNNLLIMQKNNIKVGLLNYTYGTNGLPTPQPTIVNRIDKEKMLMDIQRSKEERLDKLIVMLHWGEQYKSHPSKKQVDLANFLFKNGVDIIIGSHPHVLQKMEYFNNGKEHLIVYSLGNYISNQRTRKRDGGAMLQFTLSKENNNTTISNQGYYLTWVHKFKKDNKLNYEILSCTETEKNNYQNLDSVAQEKIKLFIKDSRELYQKENQNVLEIKKTHKK